MEGEEDLPAITQGGSGAGAFTARPDPLGSSRGGGGCIRTATQMSEGDTKESRRCTGVASIPWPNHVDLTLEPASV